MVAWLFARLLGCLLACLLRCLVGWLVASLAHCLVRCFGWLIAWLVLCINRSTNHKKSIQNRPKLEPKSIKNRIKSASLVTCINRSTNHRKSIKNRPKIDIKSIQNRIKIIQEASFKASGPRSVFLEWLTRSETHIWTVFWPNLYPKLVQNWSKIVQKTKKNPFRNQL